MPNDALASSAWPSKVEIVTLVSDDIQRVAP
jgi:hypothetical protein